MPLRASSARSVYRELRNERAIGSHGGCQAQRGTALGLIGYAGNRQNQLAAALVSRSLPANVGTAGNTQPLVRRRAGLGMA